MEQTDAVHYDAWNKRNMLRCTWTIAEWARREEGERE